MLFWKTTTTLKGLNAATPFSFQDFYTEQMFWSSALNRSSPELPHQGKDPKWPTTSSQSHPWFSSPAGEHRWVKINLHFQHFRACRLFAAVHFREGVFWGVWGGGSVCFSFCRAHITVSWNANGHQHKHHLQGCSMELSKADCLEISLTHIWKLPVISWLWAEWNSDCYKKLQKVILGYILINDASAASVAASACIRDEGLLPHYIDSSQFKIYILPGENPSPGKNSVFLLFNLLTRWRKKKKKTEMSQTAEAIKISSLWDKLVSPL